MVKAEELLCRLRDYDMYTYEHSLRVEKYAQAIGASFGVRTPILTQAARYHDVGKLLIPLSVLDKPEPLASWERHLIELHPLYGVHMLKNSDVLVDARLIILYHHTDYREYYDKPPISLAHMVAILMLADSIDAMASDRVYRKKLSVPVIREELTKYRGTRYNPYFVDRILDSGGNKFWLQLNQE